MVLMRRRRLLAETLIYLVAAESSGDAIGADLARALRAEAAAPVTLAGVGGARMALEGIQSPFDISELSVLGILEGVKAYPRVRRMARMAAEDAARRNPAAAVLIDSWGFNLRVAWGMRERSPQTRLIKYIGPQVWATRPGRARTLARTVDLLLTIHSFDAPYFERAGLRTIFTGNPALYRGAETGDGAAFRARHGLGAAPVLLILFGSRESEVKRLFDPFMGAARLLAGRFPGLRLISPVAGPVAEQVRARAAERPELLLVSEDERADAFAAASAAIACSGTVTSELALAGVPAAVAYRVDWPSYFLIRAIVRTPWISLVNIAADEALMPELIQHRCAPASLADAVAPWLADPAEAAHAGERLRAVAQALKGEMDSPARTAARAVLTEIGVPLRTAG